MRKRAVTGVKFLMVERTSYFLARSLSYLIFAVNNFSSILGDDQYICWVYSYNNNYIIFPDRLTISSHVGYSLFIFYGSVFLKSSFLSTV